MFDYNKSQANVFFLDKKKEYAKQISCLPEKEEEYKLCLSEDLPENEYAKCREIVWKKLHFCFFTILEWKSLKLVKDKCWLWKKREKYMQWVPSALILVPL